MKACVILTVVMGCIVLALVDGNDKQRSCGRYVCPGFTSKTSGKLKIRSYYVSKWLCFSVQTSKPWVSKSKQREMFFKLAPYFRGANHNEHDVTLAMPLMFKVHKKSSKAYEVTLMLYLKDRNPPKPKRSGVSIVTRPAGQQIYVKEFSSRRFPKPEYFVSKAKELKRSIGNKSLYGPDVYYASYNALLGWHKKRFEVWVDKL